MAPTIEVKTRIFRSEDPAQTPYLPETIPIVEPGNTLVTRPWLDWARRITTIASQAGTGGGGGTGTGDVVGPAGANANAIAVYNGTTGKIIKDGGQTIPQVIAAAVGQAQDLILPGGDLSISALPAHHTLHEPGGADPILNLSASILTSGLLPDARLSANVQMKPILMGDLPGNVATKPFPESYLTLNAEAGLPNARRLVAGTNITFDTSTPGQMRIDATGGGGTGTEEVFIGPSDPGTPYELWYDTDEIASNTNPVNGPATSVVDNVVSFANTAGTFLKDSGIPSGQIARKDQSNTFTPDQVFANSVETGRFFHVKGSTPFVGITDVAQPANQRAFIMQNAGQTLSFSAFSDDFGTYQQLALRLSRAGDATIGRDIYEKGRTTPLGHAIGLPGVTYGANVGTWSPGGVYALNYYLVGKLAILIFTTIGGTVSGAAQELHLLNLPFAAGLRVSCSCVVSPNSTGVAGQATMVGGGTQVYISRADYAALGPSSNTHVSLQMIIPLS